MLAFDYRGYGVSTGRPTERGLYGDADAVLERFWSAAPQRRPIVYWGRSLGTAVAAYAATVRTPDGLILESGFSDARSLVRTSPVLAFLALFSTYRFPGAEFLRHVNAPVLVMHGDNDHVIPIAHGRRLFGSIGGQKQFFTIRGGDHRPDPVPQEVRSVRAPRAICRGAHRRARPLGFALVPGDEGLARRADVLGIFARNSRVRFSTVVSHSS